jgi:hypothetical protein
MCAGVQLQPAVRAAQGTRVRARTSSLALDALGRPLPDPAQRTLEAHFGLPPTQALVEAEVAQMGTKTIWVGRDGEHVSVETFALQQYEDEGYKGFALLLQLVCRKLITRRQRARRGLRRPRALRPPLLGHHLRARARRVRDAVPERATRHRGGDVPARACARRRGAPGRARGHARRRARARRGGRRRAPRAEHVLRRRALGALGARGPARHRRRACLSARGRHG